MIRYTSELLHNTAIQNWNGRQTNTILTSSKLVKAYREGVDLKINTPLIKTLLKYDYVMFIDKLKQGFEFQYQDYTYTIQKVKQWIRVTAIYTKSLNTSNPIIRLNNVVLSQSLIDSMNGLNYCNDVKDILGELLKRGI